MAYRLTMRFTGIVAFVRLGPEEAPTGYRVLLPDTGSQELDPKDADAKCNHHRTLLELGERKLHLQGHRMVINQRTDSAFSACLGDLPQMHYVVGKELARVRRDIFDGQYMAAVLDITTGTLESVKSLLPALLWGLNDPFLRIVHASDAVWTVDLDDPIIRVLDLATGREIGDPFQLAPGNNTASLRNECECPKPAPLEDHDFLWYYSLLDSPHAVKRQMVRPIRPISLPDPGQAWVLDPDELYRATCSSNCRTCPLEPPD